MKQTILVTGATGFLGSHLVKTLVNEGYHVVILKRSFSQCDRLQPYLSHLESYNLDEHPLSDICAEIAPLDAIIHTATCYGRKGELVSELFEANTLFPLRLLTKALELGCSLFLNTDTSLSRTLNPYALSKAQFRDWGDYLSQSHGALSFLNLRLEHLVGPGDDSSKFVPYVIENCLRPAPMLDLTLGEQQRDFIYIEDVVQAYLLLLKRYLSTPEPGFSTYDIGTGTGIQIRTLVEQIKALTRSPIQLNFGAVPYRAQEVMYSVANIEPLQKLGWQPRYSLREAIEKTINASLEKPS